MFCFSAVDGSRCVLVWTLCRFRRYFMLVFTSCALRIELFSKGYAHGGHALEVCFAVFIGGFQGG